MIDVKVAIPAAVVSFVVAIFLSGIGAPFLFSASLTFFGLGALLLSFRTSIVGLVCLAMATLLLLIALQRHVGWLIQ